MGNTSKLFLAAVLALAALPAAAQAQDPGANDPEAGSPSGAIYEIPLDTARGDAAPRSGDGGADPAAGSDSPLRSENGFGSSSEVPGAGVTATTDGTSGSGSGRSDRQDTNRSDAPAGRQSGEGGAPEAAGEALIATGGTVGPGEQPSSLRAYLLLALGVLVAVAVGTAARRATR
jgi:hypothetical protein